MMFDQETDAAGCSDEHGASGNREHRRLRILVEREIIDSLGLYRGLARRRLRNAGDAEDVAQAFALKALERAGQLRDPLAVRGWLRRIFENVLVDHCRISGRRRLRETSFDLQLHDRLELAEGSELTALNPADTVSRILPRLKPEYADIVRKMDLLDRPRSDVARELGITVNNLTVRLHRARSALKDQIDGMSGGVMATAA